MRLALRAASLASLLALAGSSFLYLACGPDDPASTNGDVDGSVTSDSDARGEAGRVTCSDHSCTTPADCFPISCTCGTMGPYTIAPTCNAGCCASLEDTCRAVCADGGPPPPPPFDAGSCPVPEGGAATIVVRGVGGPIAVAGGNLYVGLSGIRRVPTNGALATSILTASDTVTRLAVDAREAWWVAGRTVEHGSLDGGATSRALDGSANPVARAIASDGMNVVFASAAGGLYLVPRDGGAPYLFDSTGSVDNVAAAGNTIVFSAGNALFSKPAAAAVGAGATKLDNQLWSAFAVYGGDVYYPSGSSTNLMRVPVGGGVPMTLGALPIGTAVQTMATDGVSLYVADTHVCEPIYRMPIGGGAATPMIRVDAPRDLAVDDTYVYWSAFDGSSYNIYRMPK